MDRAACKDKPLSLFFAPDGETAPDREARETEAKAVCNGCPVKVPCLAYRLTRPRQSDGGVWGGLNGDERNAELRRRRRRVTREQDAA
jgi:WhiB family redox-sensing transcriptional regulator